MPIGGERKAVQVPFLKYAESVRWTRLDPTEAEQLRRNTASPFLDTVLIESLRRLNPGVVDAATAEDVRDRLARVRPDIEGNYEAWRYLKGEKNVFVQAENRERNVTLVDFEDLRKNVYHVTDEFVFDNGTPPAIRTDMMLFVNGIPLVVGEAKAAHVGDGVAQALDDLRHYHRDGPELFAVLQVHCLTGLVQFYYGATWNLSRKGLFNWRDEQEGDYEQLVRAFCGRERLLRTLRDYVIFTRKDGDLSKTVLRPHQMRATEKCVERAADATKRRGLIWHTQGSGKTYTMITVARRLLEDPLFGNPTVLMLVDRNELETQLFGNLEATAVGGVFVAPSKVKLREVLAAKRRGLVVSMIHKFDKMPARLNDSDKVVVLIDEAHRSTGGDLGNYLVAALPNATFLGFTGTPIDRTQYGKGTFKFFGIDDEKGYLDKYSIRESLADKTTVPLKYELAPNELKVDRELLEKEFLDLAEAEGVSDVAELNRVLEKAVNLRNELKNDERVDKVAAYVASHFRQKIDPLGYKAFLVAVDREACVLYKKALDKYLDPALSAVVISSLGKKDSPELRSFQLTDDQEKTLRKRFCKSDDELKILIVTEKLLTGFDAPILYGMYLDKPMRDHVLLQAIARVNRPYEDAEGREKPCGFVFDFVGIFENLEKALAFDSQDVESVIEGLPILQERFMELMDEGRERYLRIGAGLAGDKEVEAVLETFRDETARRELYDFFRDLEDLHDILSPDPLMEPFLADFGRLAELCRLVKSSYERGVSVDKSFSRKTAALVRKHTSTDEVREPVKAYELGERALEALGTDAPDIVKVVNLLKELDRRVRERGDDELYLVSIGQKAQEIANRFELRQDTTRETLDKALLLLEEARAAARRRGESPLSAEAFAVELALESKGLEKATAEAVAASVDEAIAEFPHWLSAARQEQEVRKVFYKALIQAKVDGVVDLVGDVFQTLRGRR